MNAAARHLLRLLLCLALGGRLPAADSFTSVYLSEVVAENRTGLRDEDGERFSWIELHNGAGTRVNLDGWFLTDTPTNRTKWRIPNLALLPDKSLVIFASGKDRTKDLVHPHANFRLQPGGGYLALVNRATNVVSEFAPGYPALPANTAFGSTRGEPAMRGLLGKATPGKPNASQGAGFAPVVQFSQPSGTFTDPFLLELSTTTTGAVIRYTLDGTLPSAKSPIYTAPFSITNTAHIRARAYQDPLLPGPPRSETYLELFTNTIPYTSSLPVLVLDTFGRSQAVSAQGSSVHVSVYEPVQGVTSLTNAPTLSTRAGYRVRGSTSSGMPQSGFALEFLDEFNQEKNQPLLGLPADSDWVLYAPNAYDPVLIHNPFIHQLSRNLGRYSPRTRFVEVFWVQSAGRVKQAHYHGLCVLEEKIKIGRQRVNISSLSADDVTPPEVTGGYLLKFDRLGPGESGVFSNGDRGMVHVEPKEQTLLLPQRLAQHDYLVKFFTDFDRVLHGPQWKDPENGYRAYFDVEAAVDFHVLEVLSGNVDALVLSTYFYKPRNGKITFGPHWDFDRALGSTDGRDDNPRTWNTGPFFAGQWWPRLFSDPDFWQQWVDRWQELRGSHFSQTNLEVQIDQLAAELRDAQPRQYARWNFQPRGGSYQGELALMKAWLSNRLDFIDGQLTPPPRVLVEGEARTQISLSAPTNTTIFYTLDGSDPRLPQGGIATNALPYSAPIILGSETRVVARANNPQRKQTDGPPISTPWSGPIRAGAQ